MGLQTIFGLSFEKNYLIFCFKSNFSCLLLLLEKKGLEGGLQLWFFVCVFGIRWCVFGMWGYVFFMSPFISREEGGLQLWYLVSGSVYLVLGGVYLVSG